MTHELLRDKAKWILVGMSVYHEGREKWKGLAREERKRGREEREVKRKGGKGKS